MRKRVKKENRTGNGYCSIGFIRSIGFIGSGISARLTNKTNLTNQTN
jgi:hypothetical protein